MAYPVVSVLRHSPDLFQVIPGLPLLLAWYIAISRTFPMHLSEVILVHSISKRVEMSSAAWLAVFMLFRRKISHA